MIKSLTVTNHLGESMTLELGSPEKSGFSIQDIPGLGPSKADINTTDMATSDGAIFNSARVNKRNIVLNLGFLPNPTIEDTRLKSYKYFPIKRRIHLVIETDNRIAETYAYVESNEPNIFSKNETAVISLICPSPYLYSVEKNITLFSTIESFFEFPFSNESLTDDLLEFGNILNNSENTVYYTGDTATGVVIYIHALGPVTNLRISNSRTQELLAINDDRLIALTGSGIINGDDIIISTIVGNKYIYLIRDGVAIKILNTLGKNPDWFQIDKGDNLFRYLADTGMSNLQFRIENKIIYEGV